MVNFKFGVVIPTFNRLEKLKIALKCYEEQIYAPKYVIIVNNYSTDGTYEFLKEYEKKKTKFKKIILNMETNTGASMGFYAGFEECLKLDIDWVWVSDDDAFPEKNCFEIANDFLNKSGKKMDIAALCGTVVNHGKIDVGHRRTITAGFFSVKQKAISESEYEKEYFKIDLFSYVGTFINTKKLKKAGLTKTGYFVYYDDTEHSYRISKQGDIICLPAMRIKHDGLSGYDRSGVNFKYYYLIRNTLDFIRTHFGERRYRFYLLRIRFVNYAFTTLFYDNKIAGYKLINAAIKAAKAGQQGLDSVYKPGWKPNNHKATKNR